MDPKSPKVLDDIINNAGVWEIAQDYLPGLRREVDQLLRETKEQEFARYGHMPSARGTRLCQPKEGR